MYFKLNSISSFGIEFEIFTCTIHSPNVCLKYFDVKKGHTSKALFAFLLDGRLISISGKHSFFIINTKTHKSSQR